MHTIASVLIFAVLVSSTPWQPNLFGCQTQLVSEGLNFNLVRTTLLGPYYQCDYFYQASTGGGSGTYCFYYAANRTLSHYPNTSLPVDSNPACPTTMPLAGNYLIKTSTAKPGKCVTMASNSDGAAVQIRDCDYRHGNPSQTWHFVGSTIMQDNKCLDVTDGKNTNGVKLQVWTCADGNPNQQFSHSGGQVLELPDDRISWMAHTDKCLDLTDGKQDNGTPLQIWSCGSTNPNQLWAIEPLP